MSLNLSCLACLPDTDPARLPSAEFYAPDLGPANLELLSRFFAKYPEYVDRTFLVVKVMCARGYTSCMSDTDYCA